MKSEKLTDKQKQEIISLMQSRGAIIGYLFGSYARGTAGPLSDIDVGVAFPHDMPQDIQESRIEEIRNGLEKKFGGRDKADVINVPIIKSPLLRYIITLGEGSVLFANDEMLRNRIADYARRDYEDTKPLRAIQRQALPYLFI